MTEEIKQKLETDKMYDTILNLYERCRRQEVGIVFGLNKIEKILWGILGTVCALLILLLILGVNANVISIMFFVIGLISILIIAVDKAFMHKTKIKDTFKLACNEMRDLVCILKEFNVDVTDINKMNSIIDVYKERLRNPDKRLFRERPQSILSGVIGGLVILVPQALLSLVNQKELDIVLFAQTVICSAIILFTISQLIESIRNTFVDDACRTFILMKLIERLTDIRDFGSLSYDEQREIQEKIQKIEYITSR